MQMSETVSIPELIEELRRLSQSSVGLETSIEAYLADRLHSIAQPERLLLLERLARQFEASRESMPGLALPSAQSSRLVTLLFGKQISIADLSPSELSEKLAQSLNTVFNTLNQIIGVVNTTLLGQKPEQETIRQIIGMHIGGGAGDSSLQNYLDRIRDAFLIAHKAFRQATGALIGEMLTELDPAKIEASTEKGLKFGALRKAELFDTYKERFRTIREGLESGRLMDDFLREFEMICQKLYKTEPGRVS
jgi:hypothetical protein